MKSGEFRQKYPHLTTPEPEVALDPHCRLPLVLDGTPESVKDQTIISALATLVDFAQVKHGRFFVQLRPTTLAELGRMARMRPETIKTILGRLQDQHRIYLRQAPQRNYKSRTIIQAGVGPGLVLFAPRLTPEYLFNQTSRALFDATRNGHDTEQIRKIIQRAEEHLQRFRDQQEMARLRTQLQKTKDKFLRSETPQERLQDRL